MELLNWLIEATSVTGLAVYSAGMTLIMAALAWPIISIADKRSNCLNKALEIRLASDVEGPKRLVTLRRDGNDFRCQL